MAGSYNTDRARISRHIRRREEFDAHNNLQAAITDDDTYIILYNSLLIYSEDLTRHDIYFLTDYVDRGVQNIQEIIRRWRYTLSDIELEMMTFVDQVEGISKARKQFLEGK